MPAGERVRLTFTSFDLVPEVCGDFVQVYDGSLSLGKECDHKIHRENELYFEKTSSRLLVRRKVNFAEEPCPSRWSPVPTPWWCASNRTAARAPEVSVPPIQNPASHLLWSPPPRSQQPRPNPQRRHSRQQPHLPVNYWLFYLLVICSVHWFVGQSKTNKNFGGLQTSAAPPAPGEDKKSWSRIWH